MNYLKLLIIILFILYIINPLDLIPDIAPIAGWLDDAFLLGVLIYYLKRGRFPGFFFRRMGPFGTGQNFYRQFQGSGPRDQNQSDSGSTAQAKTGFRDPYQILGVTPGSSAEEIRAAYRKAVQTYHPDKVSHLGKEFQELAEQKFIEIQNAYEQIKPKGER